MLQPLNPNVKVIWGLRTPDVLHKPVNIDDVACIFYYKTGDDDIDLITGRKTYADAGRYTYAKALKYGSSGVSDGKLVGLTLGSTQMSCQ